MSVLDIPDQEIIDDFLEAKTCPTCIASRKLSKRLLVKHDTRLCLNQYLIVYYMAKHSRISTAQELKRYSTECIRDINKHRKLAGKIEI